MIEIVAPKVLNKPFLIIGGSKSISNRLLMIKFLFHLNTKLYNLSDAEDTQLLVQALEQIKSATSHTIDVKHAGTNMRFLTALLSITPGEWVITGSSRMKQRPIGVLVGALKTLGAEVQYLEQENYPPLLIKGTKLKGGQLKIDGSISSQFISALLLIAPALENGLELVLEGNIVSRPYIRMTILLLKQFGVEINEKKSILKIAPHNKQPVLENFHIESDWSSASYYYSLCALSKNSKLELQLFTPESLQADSVLAKLFIQLGVQTEFKKNGISISSVPKAILDFSFDCTNCPDIAQTLAVTCFGLGINCHLSGLSTLKIKESDRILALKTELEKFGAEIIITSDSIQINATSISSIKKINNDKVLVKTYNDHRMAMSFAALSLVFEGIQIDEADVVKKSYPSFWEDLKSLGFNVNLQG